MGYVGVPFGWEGKMITTSMHNSVTMKYAFSFIVSLLLTVTTTNFSSSKEAPYALLPLALASHPCYHYVEYLDYYKPNSTSENLTSLYYVDDFERIDGPAGQSISAYA